MAEAEVEQLPAPNENGLQWTLGDDEGEDNKSEQEDTFGGANKTAPSHSLSAAHLAALQEKRKRLK